MRVRAASNVPDSGLGYHYERSLRLIVRGGMCVCVCVCVYVCAHVYVYV